QAQWVARMGTNPSQFSTAADSPSRPVERITWNDTQSFLAGTGLRLPTEAEWELACRAGTTASRYGLAADIAWTTANAGGQTKPVATRAANALGLHDTLGNVYEWVADRYGPYTSAAQTDPSGPVTGTNRALRGGSYIFAASFSRASERDNLGTTVGYNDVGVRVARTPGPVITGVSPSMVGAQGGTVITISGANFAGATSVKVGGVPATAVVVVSDTSVQCSVPAGALGLASVEVIGPLGSGLRANGVTYIGAPTIEFIGPNQGPSSGGTVVDIWGTNFGDLQSIGVTIGGIAATNIVSTSVNRLQVTTPAGTAGAKTVALTTVGGTASVANGFSYVNSPSVTGASPSFSTFNGGGTVTISGSNFIAPVTVRIGGTVAQNVVVNSSTSVSATVPSSGTLGYKTIEVTALGGTGSLANGFLYGSALTWGTVLEGPPSAALVTNTTMRNAIIATGRPWRVRDNATQIEMLLVPSGTFTMGAVAADANDQPDENPSHVVTLSSSFYLGRYEVTQSQWLARMGSNPSTFQGASYPDFLNRPVESVSWSAVQSFLTGSGLRLPTEAEWEFACRAGTTAVTNITGGQVLDEVGWYSVNSAVGGVRQPRVVGTKKPNALGLFDTLGNVYEHCSDWYSSTYYASSPSSNPGGPATGTARVVRGGSWNIDATFMRCSDRESLLPSSTSSQVGFRVARTP
ncbi:MAG: SUMF1/EgtB/PvdO family nonheme iron enzyme, partial [Planctomycetota bacterium]